MKTGNLLLTAIMMILIGGLFAQDSESTFNEGVKAYEAGDYQTALEQFSSLVFKHIENADIYYNIGNCYYRLDDLGDAILNYKRALRIDPSHARAQNSLNFALTQIQDKQNPEQEDVVSGMLGKINRLISLNALAIIVVALLAVVVLIVVIMIVFYRGREKSVPLFFFTIAMVLLIIVGIFGWARWRHYQDNNEAVLLADTAIGYSGPGQEYTRVFTIHEGHVFQIMKKEAEWSQIKLRNGLGGWVRSAAFDAVKSNR